MKLRIQGNSIRLRLNRPEVGRFASAGRLEEFLQYGASPCARLSYGLERSTSSEALSVDVGPNRITVLLPEAMAREWTETQRVGFQGVSQTAGGQLNILVEKDFRRLHGATKDPDLYPNPLENQV